MYNYLLRQSSNPIDIIVCPEGNENAPNAMYVRLGNPTLISKIKNKTVGKGRFDHYFEALKKVLKDDEKYIIHSIDNSGLMIPLNTFLSENFDRKNFYLLYYYQGFDVLYKDDRAQPFLHAIDELLFLTKASYQYFKNVYNELPMRCNVLYNATNSKQFYKLNILEKEGLKKELGFNSKLTFIWCSQDRQKKGLHIILDVWKRIYNGNPQEMQLLIVGLNREIVQDGVMNIGRVTNDQVAKYFQISDFYLFPSLWKEGFGIVLAEALKCGCYVIASNQGGISEVLGNGAYGKLVENPNFIQEWIEAITASIEEYIANDYQNKFYHVHFKQLYDLDTWAEQLSQIINEAKINLQ
jgi:glycosyltransferase involved in cell wall biosynthesis